ncbi:ABC transporter permease [Lichenifustis flavocetrariae]|uniref:MlaE family lipid ABC transporter permease subunit n=1 Tax=Lichenifustis flavocetrariae TaxID=2949735 RepID=A0AA41Z7H6_9HYPH|nr:MlaE family lipid ABC transporter permease subunit [Lichenifustis flavocetrariae]MCW6511740.1 MlaE family lipid ABC transporter permease subunit [Lichenifustis flavocetrariae]
MTVSASGDHLRWTALAGGSTSIVAEGSWTVATVAGLDPLVQAASDASRSGAVAVDLHAVSTVDTFGACLLDRLIATARARGQTVSISGLPKGYSGLLAAVERVGLREPAAPQNADRFAAVAGLGRGLSNTAHDVTVFLTMLGAISAAAGRLIRHPRRFRLTSAVHQLDRVGFQAIPIIALITLLIGAIVAQQGIFNFRKFGAESYVVDLVGILVLRELGVLVVAIMVAGRSGSSYTAELGSMKMREEIDALRTMGLDPVEVLILPRIIALVVALPCLAFIGAMAALLGGGLVAWFYGGMNPGIYLARLREAVSVTHLEVGLLKAPFMALVIGVVACAEGMRVQGSAESLGLRTTASVVESIFLVIVLDGLFAMIFAAIGM